MTRYKRHKSSTGQGFTLIEVLVVVGLVALVSVMIINFFRSVGTSQAHFSQQAMLQMEARRAFANIIDQIREGTDIIRPMLGETLPFMTFKDIINQTAVLYLEPDNDASRELDQAVYRLVSYRTDYSGSYRPDNERILLRSVKSMRFTSLSPTSVQVNATVLNEKGEFQFIAHVGLLNVGGL